MLSGEKVTPEEWKVCVALSKRPACSSVADRSGFDKLFSDWMGTVDVITTGEQKNKAATLENLSNVIKFVTSMQLPDGRNLALEDGPMRRLFLPLTERRARHLCS